MSYERDAKFQSGKRRVKRRHTALFDRIAEILFRTDPIGINFETNTNEYEPEVATILPRLRDAQSVEDVQRIVREELVAWFTEDLVHEPALNSVAAQIWEAWSEQGVTVHQ